MVYKVYAIFCFLWQIMADKNLEDNDIEPAPKLIEVVFQNCRGQVDHWVEPYLRITLDRLRRTEKSRLKCLLVQVVRCQDLAVFFCMIISYFICSCPVNITHSMFCKLLYSSIRNTSLFLKTALACNFLTQRWSSLTQIANAVYYNAALTLSILNKFSVTTEVFNLWFQLLQQVKKSGIPANFKRYVLLYLL